MNLTQFLFGAILLFSTTSPLMADEKLVVTYRPPADRGDLRYDYEQSALKLALDKTQDKYGSFELQQGIGMNLPRAIQTAKKDALKNFFFKTSYSSKYINELSYIPIPIDFGIVGYRVCFTSKALAEKIAAMSSIEELRTLTVGQGKGWSDVDIFRYNKFHVFEVLEYKNLFPMVAAGRFELFCRGANEILKEWEEFKNLEGLAIDKSFAFAYKFPRFFWTNKNNTEAIKRITEGLNIAYVDGSLLELWKSFNIESLNFIEIEKRKIFWLENPQLEGVMPDFEKYFYFKIPQT